MNYLAHLYLSGDDHNILLGNYIADGLKSKDKKLLSPRIMEGVELHYKIDDFIDLHPIFTRSKSLFFDKYGHYSSVILDIIYDHFLALNWSLYSNLDLKSFESGVYKLLDFHHDLLPLRSRRFLTYMKNTSALSNYGKVEGISRVLKDFSNRAQPNSGIENSPEDLIKNYDQLNRDFQEFFPLIIEFVRSQKSMTNVQFPLIKF